MVGIKIKKTWDPTIVWPVGLKIYWQLFQVNEIQIKTFESTLVTYKL